MSATFSMEIKGLDALIASAKKVGGDFPRKMKDAMVASTTIVQNEAKKVTPSRFKNRTGTLRRSIQKKVDGPEKGIVFSDEKYSEYVEFGTRPHTIYPKKARMLSFTVAGKRVFAHKVNHKGSKPYPYMQPAFEDSKPQIERIYGQLGSEVVKEMAR